MTVTAIYSSAGFTWDVATETGFNSGTASADLGVLGIGASFTSYELDNAWMEAYQIGSRIPQAYYTQGLSAIANIDFLMCADPAAGAWPGGFGFLQFVCGPSTGGTYTVGTTVASGMIKLGSPGGDVFQLGGVVFSSCKIDVRQGAAIKVSLAGLGTSFSSSAGTLAVSTITPTQLLTWKDVTIGDYAGTYAPSLVESLDITINTGVKPFYAIGSPQYQAFLPLQNSIECNITAFHQDPNIEFIYNYLANATAVGGTVVVNFGTHTATFTGCYLKKGTLQLQPVQEATNQLTFRAINVIIV